MGNKILLTQDSEWGSTVKEIIELAEKDLINYKLLGRSFGVSVNHCLQMATTHCKNFIERAVGFRNVENNDQIKIFSKATGKQYMSIEFYEKT